MNLLYPKNFIAYLSYFQEEKSIFSSFDDYKDINLMNTIIRKKELILAPFRVFF